MTIEEAKALLSKSLKDMTQEEKRKLVKAMQIVAGSWAKL